MKLHLNRFFQFFYYINSVILQNLVTIFDSTKFPPQGNTEYEIEAPFIMKNYRLALVSFGMYTYICDLSKSSYIVIYGEDSSRELNQTRTGCAKYTFDVERNKIIKDTQINQGYTGISYIILLK